MYFSSSQNLAETTGSYFADDKFIVCKNNLFELLGKCTLCGKRCALKENVTGTALTITWYCGICTKTYHWDSQPRVANTDMYTGNIQLSASILFTGAPASQTLRVLNSMGVSCISQGTFNTHSSLYLEPTVHNLWDSKRQDLIREAKQRTEELLVGGDGSYDSSGPNAKCLSYTMLDLKENKIIDMQLVQVFFFLRTGQAGREVG